MPIRFRILPLLAGLALGQTSPPPLARIGDQSIYEADLLPVIGSQLLQLRNQEYDLKLRALQTVIGQRLVEKAAANASMSMDEYLAGQVDRLLPPPAEREIEAYYLAQKDRINRPLEEVKEQVKAALTQALRSQARQRYMDQLRAGPGVSILLDRPRVDVRPDPARLRGDPSAPITIVEFSDFQCPYCREMQQVLNGLLEKYKGKVRLSFRDFPLRPIHPHAQQAAEAARCAGERNKFWEYHDLLFQDQSRLDVDSLKARAASLGLDGNQFAACLSSGRYAPMVDRDLRTGTAAGVSATPAFYVNGILVLGGQTAAVFENLIEAELRMATPSGTAP